LNEAEDITLVHPKTSKYSAGQRVILKNGKSGMIIGVDPMNNEFQIMLTDNKSTKVKGTEIEKLEKPKDSEYQESGVNPELQSEINIKNTPFDLDSDNDK
jgi:hypothetical protein